MAIDIRFRVVAGDSPGRTLELRALPAVIGRHPNADLVLEDHSQSPTLSRKHANLDGRDSTLWIKTLGINGLELDGVFLAPGQSSAVRGQSTIRLGPRHTLKVEHIHLQTMNPGSSFLDKELIIQAWGAVRRNQGTWGVDKISVEEFSSRADKKLTQLSQRLAAGCYHPLPPRIVSVSKRDGGHRRLSILTVEDRIVQQALLQVLSPTFEAEFSGCSYAYRPGRGTHDALRAVEQQLQFGHGWVVDADILNFFDTVQHPILLELLRPALGDVRLRSIVEACLAMWQTGSGRGLAQGAATSPLFANLYLTPFDRWIVAQQTGKLVRYADDFVIVCQDRLGAEKCLLDAESFLRKQLGLSLRCDKTRIVHLDHGFNFLGFRFDHRGRGPSPESRARLQERLTECTIPAKAKQIEEGWKSDFVTPQAANETIYSKILQLFKGRSDVYGVQWFKSGRNGYLPRRDFLSQDVIRGHLAGTETIGIYQVQADGLVNFLVFDVDLPRGTDDLRPAETLTWDLAQFGRSFGLPTWVEDSGQKGFHVWIFLSKPTPADEVRILGKLLACRLGVPRSGTRLEIFPRLGPCDGLGNLIKLPWGIHQATGRRCPFLQPDGQPYSDLQKCLDKIECVSPELFQKTVARLQDPKRLICGSPESERISVSEAPLTQEDSVQRVLAGCKLLKQLAEKPAQTGHLVHLERLTLLHTFGHLGASGASFLHRVLANCDNYQPKMTQRWVDRLDVSNSPLSCARLRDWLSELQGEVHCDGCHTSLKGESGRKGPYPSPVFLAGILDKRPSPRSRPTRLMSQEEDKEGDKIWLEIKGELFPEMEIQCPSSTLQPQEQHCENPVAD